MATVSKKTQSANLTAAQHPLDPMTPREIDEAVRILRSQRDLPEGTRFESVMLKEPAKDSVLGLENSNSVPREATIVLLDNDTEATHEAVVSLTDKAVTSWKHIPGVQPKIMPTSSMSVRPRLNRIRSFWKPSRNGALPT